MSGQRGERGETRRRIRSVALELFAEQGYEQTSLREIAERLGVTKAALYYHFRSKEDIVISIFDELRAEIDEVIAWGRSRPRTARTRLELLDRYAAVMRETGVGLMRFVHENQPALRELKPGAQLRDQLRQLAGLMVADDATVLDQLRVRVALFAVNWGDAALDGLDTTQEERTAAVTAFTRSLVAGDADVDGAEGGDASGDAVEGAGTAAPDDDAADGASAGDEPLRGGSAGDAGEVAVPAAVGASRGAATGSRS